MSPAAGACILLLMLAGGSPATAQNRVDYSFSDRGGLQLRTQVGTDPAPRVGYARIQPEAGSSTPSGLAIFGLRQDGVLVAETGVPAARLVQSGRIFAEVSGPINTGIAIANPNSQPATISFNFTDTNGIDFGSGTTQIGAQEQIAKFLDQDPFNSGSEVVGTFSFTSDIPVAVIALRGLTNERAEFLITTLPVADPLDQLFEAVVLPHFADGGGWTTEVVLVNPGDSPISGTATFRDQGTSTRPAEASAVIVDNITASEFPYTLPARSSVRLRTSNPAGTTRVGSVRVAPSSGDRVPSSLAVFSFRNSAGTTVSEAGVSALPSGTGWRVYAQVSETALSEPGAVSTGLAIANNSDEAITVQLELTTLDGEAVGVTGSVEIPGNGQIARFLTEIDGLETLPRPFQGVLRISTASSPFDPDKISITGLRGRTNERGDFLITTTPAENETTPPLTEETLFPHFVDDGGYTTEFILYSRTPANTPAGTLSFWPQSSSETIDLRLGGSADLAVSQTGPPTCSISANTCDGLVYTIVVTNEGPEAAPASQLTDTLPVDPATGAVAATLVSATATQGACSDVSGGVFTCDIGSMDPQTSVTITVVVNVDPTVIGRVVTNRATVQSTVPDANVRNNTADLNHNVTPTLPETDLEVRESNIVDSTTGATRELTLSSTLLNNGRSTATGVNLTVSFDDDFTLVSTTTPSGCAMSQRTLTCSIGTLGVDVPLSVGFVIRPSRQTGSVSATLTLTPASSENDPVSTNNEQTATVQ